MHLMIRDNRYFRFFADFPSLVWDRDAQVFLGFFPKRPSADGMLTQFKWCVDVVWDWKPTVHRWVGGWWGYRHHRAEYAPGVWGDVHDARNWTGRDEVHTWSWFFRFRISRDY